MTRHPIAQFARNGNPNRKKSGLAAISCEIDYFARRVWPGTSTVPRFFTDDYRASPIGSARRRRLGRSQIGIASSMSIVSESVTAIRLRKRALAPSKKISSR